MGKDVKLLSTALNTPTSRAGLATPRYLMAICIVLLAGIAVFLLSRDLWRGRTNDRPASFSLNLTDQMTVDPRLINYQQIASIDLSIEQPRAIASGPQDKIYVAGDRSIHVFGADGKSQDVIKLDSQPTCLVIGETDQVGSERLFVGTSDGIKILAADHEILESWSLPAENARLTSIAVAGDEIFAADAGNRIVWRFTATGELLGQIGKPDSSRQIPGFVIPNLYFDIVAGSEGLLYCANPGNLQVSTYSFDGDLGNSWGQSGSTIGDFFGCCNPSHLALFADGRFVTSEKGIPRIKVYTTTGELESVVAGPEQLGISEQDIGDPRQSSNQPVFDIAVDRQDRVLVLDPQTSTVRIFALKSGQISNPVVR